MKNSSQLILTFLLNACWQIAIVAALASFSSWLLRNSAARYRHWIWVTALFLSVGIPLTTMWQVLSEISSNTISLHAITTGQPEIQPVVANQIPATAFTKSFATQEAFLLNRTAAYTILAIYFAIVVFSVARLVQAWIATRRLKNSAVALSEDRRVSEIVKTCARAIIGSDPSVEVCSSTSVLVPVTIGMFNPMVILPAELIAEENDELLTSAIGHEITHVSRRDYSFNLLYELLYLSLSFHPCAALIRRRIRQTRELSCDEVVAERIMTPEVYARSLVKLASSAPPLQRLSVSTTVGIADADILEARIMSLLRKPKLDTRRKRTMLIAFSILLLVPCLTVASFAMKFDLQPAESTTAAQDPAQEKERKEKEMVETRSMDEKRTRENLLKERMEADPKFREEVMRKRELEMEMRAVRQAALVRLARITMDQAIQIATSQTAGKVLECNLQGERWEEPGKLARDGYVFYHVVLVTADDTESGAATHVWVNAVDGSIIKTEKELPRKERRPE